MSAARIFISYRTSDGVDKATALARDLSAAFGAEQVFLDKEDLAAGAPWREAIGATMSGKPVLLLLVTPQLLGPRLRREGTAAQRSSVRQRRLQLALTFCAGVLSGAAASALWWPRAASDAATASLSGAWTLRVAPPTSEIGSRLDAVTLHVTQAGEEVRLYSEPIDITRDPAWTGFAQQWQQRFGQALERVVMRGAGRARLEHGSPPAIDIGLRVETQAGSDPIETGNLSAELAADGRRMAGRVRMKGERAERAAEMTRE